MELETVREFWGKSTYLSQIFGAIDRDGKRYVIKKSRTGMSETQNEFLEWLCRTRPTGFLIPLEVNGRVGEIWEEIYEYVDWPTFRDISPLFPTEGETKHRWKFSHALKVINQLTSLLGILHSEGFIHHDVRKNNFFLNPKGLEVKLFDYNGVRRPYFLEEGQTPHNDVPPEYRTGNCPIDFRFDVYQAGGLFLDMTHGDTRDSKRILRVEAPEETLEIIAKSRKANPEERYRDCNKFHEAIKSLRIQ